MKPRRASAPTKYKWHEGAESQIRDLFDCHDSRQLVSYILHENIDEINNSIEIINSLLCGAASTCLRQIGSKRNGKRNKR